MTPSNFVSVQTGLAYVFSRENYYLANGSEQLFRHNWLPITLALLTYALRVNTDPAYAEFLTDCLSY
jgi:hypothetical protein